MAKDRFAKYGEPLGDVSDFDAIYGEPLGDVSDFEVEPLADAAPAPAPPPVAAPKPEAPGFFEQAAGAVGNLALDAGQAALGATSNLFGAGPYIEGAMGAVGEAATGDFDVAENFQRYRQGARARNEAQMARAPAVATATELGMGLAMPVARGASALQRAGAAALEGGTMAGLQSDAQTPGELAEDVALGTAFSGGIAGAPAAGRALAKSAADKAAPVSKYVARTFFGADARAISRYEQRLDQIEKLAAEGGADYEDLAARLRDSLGAMRRRVSKGSSDAFGVLPEDALIELGSARDALLRRRQNLLDETGSARPQRSQEVSVIDNMLATIEGMSADIPQIQRLEQSAQRAPSQVVREAVSGAGDEAPLTPFAEARMRPQIAEAAARPTPSQLSQQGASRFPDADMQPWLEQARLPSQRMAAARPSPDQLAQQPTQSALSVAQRGAGEPAGFRVGDDRRAAIMEQIDRIRANPRLRAPNVKRAIQDIDLVREGKGFAPGTYIDTAQRAAAEARGALDDQLKREFPQYAEVMKPLAQDTSALNAPAVQRFAKKDQTQQAKYLQRMLFDATATRKGELAEMTRVEQRLAPDAQPTIERALDQNVLDMFSKQSPGGSRRTNLGEQLGRRFGVLGAAAGATLGAAADVAGPAVGRAMLRGGIRATDRADRILRLMPSLEQQLPRAARTLMQAGNDPQKLLVTDYVMRSQDPEYRALMRMAEEQENSEGYQ